MPVTVLHGKDVAGLEEPTLVVWSQEALVGVMREVLPSLMEAGTTGEWFGWAEVAGAVRHERVLQLLAKELDLDAEGAAGAVFGLGETMEVEGPLRFRVKVESIARFVLLEHVVAKQEYSAKEMDESLWKLMLAYLPAGRPGFEEERARAALQELLPQYFLTVPRASLSVRVAYDPLLANSTVKDRL